MAALGVLSSWSITGVFLSLGPPFGPRLAATLFHTSDHLVAGFSVCVLAGPGALTQLVFGRTKPWARAAAGSVARAAGMALVVLATAADSDALYLAARSPADIRDLRRRRRRVADAVAGTRGPRDALTVEGRIPRPP